MTEQLAEPVMSVSEWTQMDQGYMNGRLGVPEELSHYHDHQNQERYYSNVSSSSILKKSNNNNQQNSSGEEEEEEEEEEMGMIMDLRRGPWTAEEDHTLKSYIAKHGEGRWNSLARCAGLKRTGKSCRLRWLNYLRPNVRRGNITLEEQLLILELHSHWGNRWSKIAQHLPGRTDNEIKNYWRTRVQKHAKQLKCDVNSKQFKDTVRYLWMPRLVERIQAANEPSSTIIPDTNTTHPILNRRDMMVPPVTITALPSYVCSENSSTSDSFNAQVSPISDMTENHPIRENYNPNADFLIGSNGQIGYSDSLTSPAGYYHPQNVADFHNMEQNSNNNLGCIGNNLNRWVADGGDFGDNMWNVEDIWLLQQQQFSNNY